MKKLKIGAYYLKKLGDDELQISYSRLTALIAVAFIGGFNAAWYYLLLGDQVVEQGSLLQAVEVMITDEPIMIFFLLVPVLVLAMLLWQYGTTLMFGNVLIISSVTRSIARNGVRVLHFDDVVRWKIRTESQSDSGDSYVLLAEAANQADLTLLAVPDAGALQRALDIIKPYLGQVTFVKAN